MRADCAHPLYLFLRQPGVVAAIHMAYRSVDTYSLLMAFPKDARVRRPRARPRTTKQAQADPVIPKLMRQ